jgi:hypothetical protein
VIALCDLVLLASFVRVTQTHTRHEDVGWFSFYSRTKIGVTSCFQWSHLFRLQPQGLKIRQLKSKNFDVAKGSLASFCK